MATVDTIIENVLKAEGGYVNDPRDRGGETNYGITVGTARAAGYTGAMRDLPRSLAKDIYRRRYVVAPGFDRIAEISEAIGHELVDTGVNMGPDAPARFLQRALNVLNRGATDFPDLVVDGKAGAATRQALRAFVERRGASGESVLLKLLEAQQAVRYIEIAEARPTNEAFMYGWVANRVGAL